MNEFRWIRWDRKNGEPPFGAITLGEGSQQYTQVLQYRYMVNAMEIGLQETIWSDWIDT